MPYLITFYFCPRVVDSWIYGFESHACKSIRGQHWPDLVSNEEDCPARHPLHHCSAPCSLTVANLMISLPFQPPIHLQTGDDLTAGSTSASKIIYQDLQKINLVLFWCSVKTMSAGGRRRLSWTQCLQSMKFSSRSG